MLYANTDDGSSALWVCDGSGVVVDNISIYGAERATILEQINEHYGTSFTGWSDNEMGLRFGDTVPNWNAYEKIERSNIAFRLIGTVAHKIPYNIGSILEKTLYLKTNGTTPYAADIDGNIIGNGGAPASEENYYITQFANYGIQINKVVNDVVSLTVGSAITDWNTYSIYGE